MFVNHLLIFILIFLLLRIEYFQRKIRKYYFYEN